MTETSEDPAARAAANSTLTEMHLPRLSTRSQLWNALIRVTAYPVIALWARTHRMPWPYRVLDRLAILLPPTCGVRRERVDLPHCSAEWYEPDGADTTKALLYLHGGAFLVGGLRTHRRLVSRISTAAGIPALSVGYRLLPKHSIETAVDDCMDGYRLLLARGHAPRQIAVAGDSAGGYFAMMVAGIAKETGLGLPGALACLSPLYDLAVSDRVRSADTSDPLFPRVAMDVIRAVAARSDRTAGATVRRTATTPDDFDMSDFPDTLIQVGSRELLVPDAVHLARRLADSGVRVRLETWRSQSHVFQVAADLFPEGRAAILRLGEFIACSLRDSSD